MRKQISSALLLFTCLAGCTSNEVQHSAATLPPVIKTNVNNSVTITDNGRSWTLGNGIVQATVDKNNGRLSALVYHGINTMHGGGSWEETPQGAPILTNTITIDPAANHGDRAEVSIKGITNGTVMLTPTAPGGGTYCNIELRYSLGRGDSGIYTYGIFSHPAAYRAMGVGESRYITRLNQNFNWISVDADRNMLECTPADWGNGVVVHAKEQRILSTGNYKNSVEHKYSYNAVQYKIPAYGWSSTKDHIGVWFINPTIEYLCGGASKQEIVCHFDSNDDPDPIILDYWRGTHYNGGGSCSIAAGEEWSKVVGPIFVYCNALENPKDPTPEELATLKATAGNPTVPTTWNDNAHALWQNALAQAKAETAKWPYDWVNGIDYPHKDQRANVTGQLILNDPQATDHKLPHLTVGLAHPDYAQSGGRFGPRTVDWAHDAKFYQFWNDGAPDGKFAITNVRPGTYTLHAFADGVLGEFTKADITVQPGGGGQNLDLGKLTWTPVRDGKQIWEIGYPDRTADKFFKGDGDNYWLWGWGLRYPLLFPNDITYTIGQSDYHKDWFFQQTPHAESTAWQNPAATDLANQRFGWVKTESLDQYPHTDTHGPWAIYGHGRANTWTINFNMNDNSKGVATLRVALAGADGFGGLAVGVNGKSVGTIRAASTNSLRYNTNKSVWYEYKQPFDATLLKPGENQLTLTVPAGDLTSGVTYDYLRLELDENAKYTAPPADSDTSISSASSPTSQPAANPAEINDIAARLRKQRQAQQNQLGK